VDALATSVAGVLEEPDDADMRRAAS